MCQKQYILILLTVSCIHKSCGLIVNNHRCEEKTFREPKTCVSPENYLQIKNSSQEYVCITGNSTDVPNRKLHRYYFENTPNVREIEVRCLIDQLDKDTFHDLKTLHKINLNVTHLIEIPQEVFHRLPITDIFIRKSKICSIQPGTFDNLPTLKSLSILSSRLANLTYNTVPHDNVTYLDYSGNQIEFIEPSTFNDIKHLKYLILYDNKISVFNFDVYLKDNLQLKELDVAHNKLTIITKMNLPKLTALDLNSNQITAIVPDAFKICRKLEKLNLSINKLITFDTTVLPDSGLPKLSIFDISDNQLTCISSDTWDLLQNLRLSFWDKNRFSCECFQQIIIWMNKKKMYVPLSVRLSGPCNN